MPYPSIIVRRSILILSLAGALTLGLLSAFRVNLANPKPGRLDRMTGWQPISGRWNEHAGVLSNSNYGRGDMLIAQHSRNSNYRISSDIRFDLLFPETHYGDAGLVIRTSNPEQGVDSYQGYYAGLRPAEGTVVLGRASYDWHLLQVVHLSTPVSVGLWYRLELAAYGCTLTVTVTPENGGTPTHLDYQDNDCLTDGVAGLRSFYAQASWQNVKLTSFPP
jgi:hypothetical protein